MDIWPGLGHVEGGGAAAISIGISRRGLCREQVRKRVGGGLKVFLPSHLRESSREELAIVLADRRAAVGLLLLISHDDDEEEVLHVLSADRERERKKKEVIRG